MYFNVLICKCANVPIKSILFNEGNDRVLHLQICIFAQLHIFEIAKLRKSSYLDITLLDELAEKIKLHHYETTKNLH